MFLLCNLAPHFVIVATTSSDGYGSAFPLLPLYARLQSSHTALDTHFVLICLIAGMLNKLHTLIRDQCCFGD